MPSSSLSVVSTVSGVPVASPSRQPVLDLPLSAVMRPEFALPLQHVMKLYTVGHFLRAWRNPKNHRSIEQVFDSAEQARHAAAVCAHWLGIKTQASPASVAAWWIGDLATGEFTA